MTKQNICYETFEKSENNDTFYACSSTRIILKHTDAY